MSKGISVPVIPPAREVVDKTKAVELVYASDLPLCEGCEEPWCPKCDEHYADCACPGPHSECSGCNNPLYDCLCDDGPTYQGQFVRLE